MKTNSMKKAFACVLALTIAAGISSCGSSEESSDAEKDANSKTESSAAASEKETEEEKEAADTTAAEAPVEPAEESMAEEETPEPEPEPEPEVDIKAMLEGYDDAYMVFDENTDPYALFSPIEGWVEDAVMPDFSIEEVGGVPMIKVYTDTTFEAEGSEWNEETQMFDMVMVNAPCPTQFKLNFDALVLPADSSGVKCHFLLKATSDVESYISVVGYDYNYGYFFHSGDNDNAIGDGMDNGYATAEVFAKNDINYNYFFVSSTYDNFEVYITHISIN